MLEAYVPILAIIATLYGSFMSVGLFPQIHKMWKRKSSGDVSLTTYVILLPGNLIWLTYGLSLSNIALIISNTIAAIGVTGVIFTYFKYKK